MKVTKDPLDYNETELRNLSIDELKALVNVSEHLESRWNTTQLASKTLINSLYGALANKWFSLFNEEMAAGITSNGRYFIRKLGNYIEDGLQKIHYQEKKYVVAGDTDSCAGSTVIKTSLGDVKIEDLYNSTNSNIEIRGKNNFIKHINNVLAASISKDLKLESKKINYIMKHKVNKRMFKIKCNGDEVIITEDHSIMVLRDNELISTTPKQIQKNEKIIRLYKNLDFKFTKYPKSLIKKEKYFEIEDIGIQEEWVYDIEVQDNHNFFGNNILIHNSVYFHIEPFMERYIEKNPNLDIDEYVTFADKFEQKVIKPIIDRTIKDFATELNAFNKGAIGVEREIIADCLLPNTKIQIKHKNILKIITLAQLAEFNDIDISLKCNETKEIIDDVFVLSNRNGKDTFNKILNVQKKVTTKDIYKLKLPNGKYVDGTGDHKIGIRIDGEIVYKKLIDITIYDDVQYSEHPHVFLCDMTGCTIEKIEYKEKRKIVYDIEVEDNHNFYANNFLVHNCAVFTAKKKYYARVRDNEGTRYPPDSPKIKVTGLEIIKSSTPIWSKKYLKQAIPHILDKDEEDLRNWVKEIKKEFIEVDLNMIAGVGGISSIDYDLNEKRVPIGSRAAIRYNNYIKENNIDDTYAPIHGGDKCKRIFLKEPNAFHSNIISYNNDSFVNEILKHNCVDYDTNFEKNFINPLNLMIEPLNYNLEKETEDLTDW
jgi:intein/homing endonuclease